MNYIVRLYSILRVPIEVFSRHSWVTLKVDLPILTRNHVQGHYEVSLGFDRIYKPLIIFQLVDMPVRVPPPSMNC